MRSCGGALANALAATALMLVVAGVAVLAADYLLVLGAERLLEVAGVLPAGWRQAHPRATLAAAGVTGLPLVLWLGWWSFRRALAGERGLGDAPCDG
jgi:hypothetical protein